MQPDLLAIAQDAHKSGNISLCAHACQEMLRNNPYSMVALFLLADIAVRVKAWEQAEAMCAAILNIDSSLEDVRANQQNLQMLRGVPTPDQTRGGYLLIKSWGFGFWSDISHTLGALLLAEITGRVPVIHWGERSLFRDDSGGDAFRHFFRPVSPVTIEDLQAIPNASIFPPSRTHATLAGESRKSILGPVSYLNREETIAVVDNYSGALYVLPWLSANHPLSGHSIHDVYGALAARYLVPLDEHDAAIEAFARKHFTGAPLVAVHMRGTDKIRETPRLDEINQSLLDELAHIDPSHDIFLLTDDSALLEQVRQLYGKRVITTAARRTTGRVGVHEMDRDDRIRNGVEVMMDAYLALRADRFIGHGTSNVSAMIAALKQWPPGTCTLIGRSVLDSRILNLFEA